MKTHGREDFEIWKALVESRGGVCGAKTRAGTPCKCPPMKNGRCRLHGGKSTDPRTAGGFEDAGWHDWITAGIPERPLQSVGVCANS
jgi:hypothetical protein